MDGNNHVLKLVSGGSWNCSCGQDFRDGLEVSTDIAKHVVGALYIVQEPNDEVNSRRARALSRDIAEVLGMIAR